MHRAQFLTLGLGSVLALASGAFVSGRSRVADPFAVWLSRYGGVASRTGDTGRYQVRPRLNELGEALQELAELSDGPIRCSYNQVEGALNGRGFTVELHYA